MIISKSYNPEISDLKKWFVPGILNLQYPLFIPLGLVNLINNDGLKLW